MYKNFFWRLDLGSGHKLGKDGGKGEVVVGDNEGLFV